MYLGTDCTTRLAYNVQLYCKYILKKTYLKTIRYIITWKVKMRLSSGEQFNLCDDNMLKMKLHPSSTKLKFV